MPHTLPRNFAKNPPQKLVVLEKSERNNVNKMDTKHNHDQLLDQNNNKRMLHTFM
jgi:hypothetical protein